MKTRTIASAAGIAAAALLASACHGTSSNAGKTSADASALATSSAAAAAKANLAVISGKCGTVTAAGQIAAVKDLGSKAGRTALWARCGVPEGKRADVETKALAAAEKAKLVTGGHAARTAYFEVTLPKIIEGAQA